MIGKYKQKTIDTIKQNFCCRSGMQAFEVNGNIIIVYQDHRQILNVMFYLYINGLIQRNNPPDIISFDFHDDCVESKPYPELCKCMNVNSIDEATAKDFFSFVEFDLSPLDNDWVKTAMEFSFIKNYVNVGGRQLDNINKNPTYVSADNVIHDFHILDHLDFELSPKGKLGSDDYEANSKIREIFRFNQFKENANEFSVGNTPLLIDFDLDCFSSEVMARSETNVPWNEKLFKHLYYGYYDTFVNQFMQCLFDRSIVITICTEPEYCGGYQESSQIFGYLNKYFFDEKLW